MARPLQEGSLTGLMLEIGEVTWLIGDRISHKSRHQYGSDNAGETWEQHEVYEAIQVAKKANLNSLHEEVELNGIPAIIKMKKQLVPWSDKPDYHGCSDEIWREICNLKAAEGCGSTPRLFDYYIGIQGGRDILPGGYIAYIVMDKVPGKDLGEYRVMDEKEQCRVQLAFLDALWNFGECHLFHYDQRLQNVTWDSEQGECYIVDLEDVEHVLEREAKDICLDPWEQLSYWGLIEDQVREPELLYSREDLIAYWEKQLEKAIDIHALYPGL